MKPIIMDLKDISDSTEAYDERPNKIFTLFIYTLFVMVVITLIWACFWKLDIVVKGDGILKVKNSSNIISTEVTGRVTVSNLEEGIYVEEGEILLTIDHTKDDEKLQLCNDMLLQTEERLTILEGYMNFLNDDISDLNSYENNKYYEEYMNRLEIINNNKDADELTRENQIIQYKQNIKKIEETLTYYQNKKSKYNQAINCINNGENSFSEYDTYYYSLIEDYFLSYNTISEKYQNNEGIITDDGKRELSSLELEQISMLQQQITSIEETELTLNGNLETVQMDLLLISNGTEDYSNSALVLKEKNAISIDIANYEAKKKEYIEDVKDIKDNISKCDVKAEHDGYVSVITQIEVGQYIQSGISICEIIPKEMGTYYAEVYISNNDIGMITEGQNVKLEIAAYPASEYGIMVGTVDIVAKDIKIDSSTGNAFYIVKVKCEQTEPYNKESKSINVINGMACQVKIVTDEQRVIQYVLNKIDLID